MPRMVTQRQQQIGCGQAALAAVTGRDVQVVWGLFLGDVPLTVGAAVWAADQLGWDCTGVYRWPQPRRRRGLVSLVLLDTRGAAHWVGVDRAGRVHDGGRIYAALTGYPRRRVPVLVRVDLRVRT